jgi:glycosyltransferase involved in cell wall biosynthesis
MKVLAIEPFAAGSHRSFLEGFAAHSAHSVELLLMPARHWKWRMRTASLALASQVAERRPDALFVSDYLGLAELLALLPGDLRQLPVVVYFHENQLTYPLRDGESRDVHHGLTNIHSALAATRAVFNSEYHQRVFLEATAALLGKAPEVNAARLMEQLESKCHVTPLGTDLARGQPTPLATGEPPVLLWNHRWEYDKAPELFRAALDELAARGFDFHLRLLGQRFRKRPAALEEIESRFAAQLLQSEHAPSRTDYLAALDASHIAVSTARHEFFGLATLEALRRGLAPVLPDDLAYPELLPTELRCAPFLYDPSRSPTAIADAITRTTERLRGPHDPRSNVAQATERYLWNTIAPALDAHLVAAVAACA